MKLRVIGLSLSLSQHSTLSLSTLFLTNTVTQSKVHRVFVCRYRAYYVLPLFWMEVWAKFLFSFCSLENKPSFPMEPLDSQGVIHLALGEYEIPASEIWKGLYLGNKDNAYNSEYLQALGVTHILNVAMQAECPHHDKFVCKHIPLLDTEDENLLEPMEDALDFIDEGLCEGRVLVHCISGMSRSAAIVAAWFIRREGIDVEEAISKVQDPRPIVDPNEGFRQQLVKYAHMRRVPT